MTHAHKTMTSIIQGILDTAGITPDEFSAWLVENNLKVEAEALRTAADKISEDDVLRHDLTAQPGATSQEIVKTWLNNRADNIHARAVNEFYSVDATFPDDGYYLIHLAEGAYKVQWYDEIEGYDTPLLETFTTRADALRAMFLDWKRTGNLSGADLTAIKEALREAEEKGE